MISAAVCNNPCEFNLNWENETLSSRFEFFGATEPLICTAVVRRGASSLTDDLWLSTDTQTRQQPSVVLASSPLTHRVNLN